MKNWVILNCSMKTKFRFSGFYVEWQTRRTKGIKMKNKSQNKIISVIIKLGQKLITLAREYGLAQKIYKIILESGVLDDIQKQIADFALVAVYHTEFAFNKIGKEKKQLAFKMICNFIKYPLVLKPLKPLIEDILYNKISDEIEDAVIKLKEHLKECLK